MTPQARALLNKCSRQAVMLDPRGKGKAAADQWAAATELTRGNLARLSWRDAVADLLITPQGRGVLREASDA